MAVAYEKHGAVGVVTLSRPQARNAWGPDFNEGLARHFAAMEEDDEIRCAILTGDEAGGAFSAGANLKDPRTHTQDSAAEFIKGIAKRRGRAFEVLGEFPKPIVGAVNGYAVGIGCIITFCCDLLVASERAEWRLPQVAARHPARLRRRRPPGALGGQGQAMRLILGFPLCAEEAHRIGLAQWVVPHDQLMDKALEVAEHIASLPPLAARLAKESLLREHGRPQPVRRLARRPLPLHGPRADRGQGRGARGLAGEAAADLPRPVERIPRGYPDPRASRAPVAPRSRLGSTRGVRS